MCRRCRIISAEHLERVSRLVECGQEDIRDQVCFRVVSLANLSLRVRAGSIEVTQRDAAKTIGRIVIGEQILGDKFCLPVGLMGRAGCISSIGEYSGFPLDRCRGRKNKIPYVMTHQGVQQVESTHDIVAIVDVRVPHRFAHKGLGREVHGGRIGCHAKNLLDVIRNQQVALDKRSPADGCFVSGRKVVKYSDLVPARREQLAHVRTDISRTRHTQEHASF